MEERGISKYMPKAVITGLLIAALALVFLISCSDQADEDTPADSSSSPAAVSGDAAAIAEARGLTPDDITAALKTYTPTGVHDEYIMFASGGHSGQVYVIGMPSMRIIKQIAVFTPEPWQGYGYGAEGTMATLESGDIGDHEIRWGDTHHPALSETGGDYDGEWLFINDKANARLATIDLRDFETKQIVKNPIAINDHGGSFVTPDTEWVIEGGQYAAPLGWEYSSLDNYATDYRGMVTIWKFDREAGRLDPDRSFAIELPPYWQDLCDAGKNVSEGWLFCNSFNTEMATGGVEDGNPALRGRRLATGHGLPAYHQPGQSHRSGPGWQYVRRETDSRSFLSIRLSRKVYSTSRPSLRAPTGSTYPLAASTWLSPEN